MQDRYYGRDDPVARKILATHADSQGLAPPDDQSIVSVNFPVYYDIGLIHISRRPYSCLHCQPMPQSLASARGWFSHYLKCSRHN